MLLCSFLDFYGLTGPTAQVLQMLKYIKNSITMTMLNQFETSPSTSVRFGCTILYQGELNRQYNQRSKSNKNVHQLYIITWWMMLQTTTRGECLTIALRIGIGLQLNKTENPLEKKQQKVLEPWSSSWKTPWMSLQLNMLHKCEVLSHW